MAARRREQTPAAPPVYAGPPPGYHLVPDATFQDLIARASRGAELGVRAAEVTSSSMQLANAQLVDSLGKREKASQEKEDRILSLLKDNSELRSQIGNLEKSSAELRRDSEREVNALKSKELELEAADKKIDKLLTFVKPFLGPAATAALQLLAPGIVPALGGAPVPEEPSAQPGAVACSLAHIAPWRGVLAEVLGAVRDETMAGVLGLVACAFAAPGGDLGAVLALDPARVRAFLVSAVSSLTDDAAAHLRVRLADAFRAMNSAPENNTFRSILGAVMADAGQDRIGALLTLTAAAGGSPGV